MRIGLIIERYDPRRGGVEQWTSQFANQVTAWGHEVHVLARSFPKTELPPGIVAHQLEVRSRRTFPEAVETALGHLPVDVVLDTGCGWSCDVLQSHGGSRQAAFERNVQLASWWVRPWKRVAEKFFSRYREFRRLCRRQYGDPNRLFVAISKMVAADLKRYHGVASDRIRLVYNGVDTERFSPQALQPQRAAVRRKLGITDGEVVLLIVAHNFRLKGVPTLLRSTATLLAENRPVRTVIVGGRKLKAWRQAAAQLGVGEQVAFVGSIDDPRPYYAAADVYVQPTFYDPCSLVLLEALACGLPVVTTKFNGASEMMTPGEHGFIIDDPADDAELTAALRPLFDGPRRLEMGVAARAVAEEHTFAENCREMLEVLREAAARRNPQTLRRAG